MTPRPPRPLTRRLSLGAALDARIRGIVGDGDPDDLPALIASRDAQTELVTDTMREAGVAVIDRGGLYTLTLHGRAAQSTVSPEGAILNWARAARRDWIAYRNGRLADPADPTAPPQRTTP